MRISVIALVMVWVSTALAGEVAFTSKPVAKRNGDRVTISFAVGAPTDVAVFVEDAEGEVVRHLVAGVLGKNPPPPLKPGLAQSVEWDGKADYGKPAGAGPFKVRVALGMGASFDRVVSSRPTSFEWIAALGTAPDGTLYVRSISSPAVWDHTQLVALDRDGKYLRTLCPFSAGLEKQEVAAYGVIELDGRPAPANYRTERAVNDALAGHHGPRRATIGVGADGKDVYFLLGSRRPYAEPGIVRLTPDGACPQGPFCEPLFPGKKMGVGDKQPTATVLSGDGKHLFFAGLTSDPGGNRALSAVYRVPVPARKGVEVFFGDPAKKGAGKDLLGGAPSGLALDGKGNLLVADGANGRVLAVDEKSGKCTGELKVPGVLCLGASRKTGTVYVTVPMRGGAGLLKFDSVGVAKPSAELPLPGFNEMHIMTVDPVAEPPVVWFGNRVGVLLRIEDVGGKLEAKTVSAGTKAKEGTQEGYMGLVVDRLRKEIYVRNGSNGGLWERFSEKTGQMEKVLMPEGSGGGGKGMQLSPAPDGNLYGLRWPYQFYRFGRDGKPLPWEKPKRPWPDDYDPTKRKGVCPKLLPHIGCVPVAMGELPHTLGVRWSDGRFLIQEATVPVPGGGARTTKSLHEYLPTGERVTKLDGPIIWKMTDAAVGPKLDAAGNIYVAEIVRPKGWTYPEELRDALAASGQEPSKEAEMALGGMYGSVVKFSPKGGMFHFGTGQGADKGPDPFKGRPKLNGLESAEYDYFRWKLLPVKVTGAEWVHPGIGHVGLYGCNCENVTFDVDEFGRVFFPDLALFRVRVIDTAGNAIAHFGSYGNPDDTLRISDCGLRIGAEGAKQPARLGAASRKSEINNPQSAIYFAWLVGVGATDGYVYTGDAVNRQMLRSKITYAAEETCEVR